MKLTLASLLLIPSTLFAQQSATLAGAVRVEIRSTETTRVASVRFDTESRLLAGVGVLRPAPGTVHCGPSGCVATTPATLQLSSNAGRVRVSVAEDAPVLEVTVVVVDDPTRRVVARGRSLTFERSATGALSLSAPEIDARNRQ